MATMGLSFATVKLEQVKLILWLVAQLSLSTEVSFPGQSVKSMLYVPKSSIKQLLSKSVTPKYITNAFEIYSIPKLNKTFKFQKILVEGSL
jgi:hypothetical protein